MDDMGPIAKRETKSSNCQMDRPWGFERARETDSNQKSPCIIATVYAAVACFVIRKQYVSHLAPCKIVLSHSPARPMHFNSWLRTTILDRTPLRQLCSHRWLMSVGLSKQLLYRLRSNGSCIMWCLQCVPLVTLITMRFIRRIDWAIKLMALSTISRLHIRHSGCCHFCPSDDL